MEKGLILITDDEKRIARLVGDFLRDAGFQTLEAFDGEAAFELFCANQNKISLVILDVMMPKSDGWETLKNIRSVAQSEVPVIMLTARGEVEDQLEGFRRGADDYVTKPFSPSVLVARVQSLLKRIKKDGETVIQTGEAKINMQTRVVSACGIEQTLTPKEYDLLAYFLNNKGIALSREKILNAVWNYDYFGDIRTVDTHVKQLRAKLNEGACIQTVRGLGYIYV